VRRKHSWEDEIRMDLKEVCKLVDLTQVTQDLGLVVGG
jgi:hypothetical protein